MRKAFANMPISHRASTADIVAVIWLLLLFETKRCFKIRGIGLILKFEDEPCG
jgi:hypothetical protein